VSAIKAVFFDFQDTLAYFDRGAYKLYVEAAAEHGVTVTEDVLLMSTEDAWAEYQTPVGPDHSKESEDEESFLEVRVAVHCRRLANAGIEGPVAEAIGRHIDELEAQPERYALFEDTMPALDRLARAGIASIVVSNHIWRLPEVVRGLGLGSRLGGVLTSARVGYRKPHPEIYAAALRLASCEPAEAIFVGDSPSHDVEGPRRSGMHALLIDRAATAPGDGVITSLTEVPLEWT
jgi:putative hydrolase of the HAD superfamily